MADMSLTIYASKRDHAVGRIGYAWLYVWRKNVTLEAVEIIKQAHDDAARAGHGRVCAFGLVEAEAPLPPRHEREVIAQLMNETWRPAICCSALVFEGTGLRASAVRSVATGLALLARQPFPHHVYGSLSKASAWLCIRLQAEQMTGFTPYELEQAILTLRRTPPSD